MYLVIYLIVFAGVYAYNYITSNVKIAYYIKLNSNGEIYAVN